jgi:2-dehydro-3-deoxyphosphooctonate aldolase (KDO 8-P synthase)
MSEFKISDDVTIGDGGMVLIAGPCVAESLDICREIAGVMKELCASKGVSYVFKASFDKANRTSGSSYRGPGIDKGLDMLSTIKREFRVPVLTDVHLPSQAAEIAEVVDFLQIPAFLCRQTDLLLACGETGVPVNIKKGQFMAPEDMKGAVEKVESTGNRSVALTERGAAFGYHNLVVDMRSLVTMRALGSPVVFDATHSVQIPGGLGHASGGRREFVRPLARAAAAVGVDALFLETHPRPDQAKSDGPNSVDFETAELILDDIARIHGLQLG